MKTTRSLQLLLALALALSAGNVFAQEVGGAPPAEPGATGGAQASSEVSANSPASAKPISLGILLGYGIDFDKGNSNPYGVGLGLRGGYTLNMGLYVGGQFIYFIGDSEEAGGMKASINVMTLGVEVGYDLKVAPVLIRPSLGLGLAFASASVSGSVSGFSVGDQSNTETYFYVAPGASVIYPINMFFVGADLRLIFMTSDPLSKALTIMLTGGINL